MEIALRGFRLSPAGVRFLSTSKQGNARKGFGGAGGKSRDGAFSRKDASTILEDEKNGVFRVLDIGKPVPFEQYNKKPWLSFDKAGPPRHSVMKPDQDWGSVWPAAQTFHPAIVPLPLRQGVTQVKKQVIPSKYANAELMKVPNFLHLTPPVIKKHCDAIKKFCTPWPDNLDTQDQIDKHFPLQVITSSYLNSSSSIRDKRSRIVVIRFNIDSLQLDKHARDKFIRLLGDRFELQSGLVTLTTDRCPYRGQNLDYSSYLVTALYFEAWRTAAWEQKDHVDIEEYSVPEGEQGEFIRTLKTILNKGEDEASLREYKEVTRTMLDLPPQEFKPELVNN